MSGPLFADVRELGGVIALSGKLDDGSGALFDRLLAEVRGARCAATMVDLEGVEVIKMAGIRALVAFSRALAEAGCVMGTRAPRSGPVCLLIRATGSADLLRLRC